ncbi:MAG: HEPN domain-containing protein, partial [Candidatus Altiarchaeales archaeon]|nr:HEPN domain-containing protein [Candidatus Altiarchaeales archaeon]
NPEIIVSVTGYRLYQLDMVYVLDGGGKLLWKKEFDRFQGIVFEDIDNDGYKEVIVSWGKVREQIPRGGILIYNRNGKQIHEFPKSMLKSTSVMRDLHVRDLDDNGYYEIIGSSASSMCALRDDYTAFLWKTYLGEDIETVVISDFDGDGEEEIIANSRGSIYALNSRGMITYFYMISFIVKEVVEENKTIKGNASVGENITVGFEITTIGGIDYLKTGNIEAGRNDEILAISSLGIFYVFGPGTFLSLGGNTDLLDNVSIGIMQAGQENLSSNCSNYSVTDLYDYLRVFKKRKFATGEFIGKIKQVELVDPDRDNYMEVLIGTDDAMYVLDIVANTTLKYNVDGGLGSVYVNNDLAGMTLGFFVSSGNHIYALSDELELEWGCDLGKMADRVYVVDVGRDRGEEFITEHGGVISAFDINWSYVNKYKLAGTYYATAQSLLDEGDYQSAYTNAQRARGLFMELGDSEKTSVLDSMIGEIELELNDQKKKKADKHFDEAMLYYSMSRYGDALNSLQIAREIYSDIGDGESVARCDSKRASIIEAMETTTMETTIRVTTSLEDEVDYTSDMLLVGLLVIAAVVLISCVVFLIKKSRRKEPKRDAGLEAVTEAIGGGFIDEEIPGEEAVFGETVGEAAEVLEEEVPDEEAPDEEAPDEEVPGEPEETSKEDMLKLLEGNINDVKEKISAIEDINYEKIMEIEKANKNRKGIIRWLRNREIVRLRKILGSDGGG